MSVAILTKGMVIEGNGLSERPHRSCVTGNPQRHGYVATRIGRSLELFIDRAIKYL